MPWMAQRVSVLLSALCIATMRSFQTCPKCHSYPWVPLKYFNAKPEWRCLVSPLPERGRCSGTPPPPTPRSPRIPYRKTKYDWMECIWLAERKNVSHDDDDDTLVKLTDVKIFAEECVSVSVSIQVFLWPPSHCHKYSWRRTEEETQVKAMNVISFERSSSFFLLCVWKFLIASWTCFIFNSLWIL